MGKVKLYSAVFSLPKTKSSCEIIVSATSKSKAKSRVKKLISPVKVKKSKMTVTRYV